MTMAKHVIQYIIPVPAMEVVQQCPPNVAIWNEKPERYDFDGVNAHHWTSKYVWEKVIQPLSILMGITFNPDDFSKIDVVTERGDFSYHNYIKPINLTFTDHVKNITLTGDFSILRAPNLPEYGTLYHQFYRGAHSISTIVNHSANNTRYLLVNGDSMTIPLIPLLAPYFNTIVMLDNRDKPYVPNLINYSKITDYMAMFTTTNWIVNNRPYTSLQPYMRKT